VFWHSFGEDQINKYSSVQTQAVGSLLLALTNPSGLPIDYADQDLEMNHQAH